MKVIPILATMLCGGASADQVGGLLPSGEMTDQITSVETAFPGETYVSRHLDQHSKSVSYEIRLFAPELLKIDMIPKLWDVVLVVSNTDGEQLISVPIAFTGLSSIPPSKEQFKSIRFSVHESFEATTVLNFGRFNGMRVIFTQYKLPLRSIEYKKKNKSEQAAPRKLSD